MKDPYGPRYLVNWREDEWAEYDSLEDAAHRYMDNGRTYYRSAWIVGVVVMSRADCLLDREIERLQAEAAADARHIAEESALYRRAVL